MQFENTFDDFHLTKLSYKNSEKLPDKLKKSLDKIALREGYKSYNIIHRTVSTDGGNFMGILYEVDIKGQLDSEEKETNVFIKQSISQKNVKILDVSTVYSKELFFYGEVSKLFEELENEASVPLDDRFKYAKIYEESSVDAIILQNLNKEGYGTVHRLNVLPRKFAELSIQQLARFHALSFIIELKRPDFFKRKIETLKTSMLLGEAFDNYCKQIYKTSVSGLDCEWKIKMKENFYEYLEHYKRYFNSDEKKIRCLCHGDYRMSNILMKTSNGVIDDVIPVDFQLLHYGSPMTDFMYLIFTATDKKFRKHHLEHLKNLYFNTMERFLNYFTIDITNVYPREQFENDYNDSLKYGLEVMLFLMPFCFTIEDDVPDLSKNNVFDITVKVNKIYHERLMGIIEDMIVYGKI